MNNNNDFSNNTFTWVLENHSTTNNNNNNTMNTQQPIANNNNTKQSQEPFGLSDADLFQFLLGEEAQQAVMSDTKIYEHKDCQMEEDSSNSENEPHSSSSNEDYKPNNNKKKSVSHPPVQSSTSRLDFRPINDYIPESQLKAMTSKERRQLRNKISARNFRNRRKEYIGTLEDELNQQKAENSQLKLEIKWIKAKMEKLQKENDKLRVDLVLGGIVLPSPPQQPQIQQQQSPYLLDSSTIINSTLNLTSSTTSSSDESNLSSPPNLFTDFPDNWDFALPLQQPNQSQTQQPDTYLSHAMVPNWNINQVLSKETSVVPATNNQLLFQQYPLLAPALMSIVLAHTMTMSTDEILATAKLSPPPRTQTAIIPYNEKEPFAGSTIMTNKEAQAVWNILEPLTLMKDRNAQHASAIKTAANKEDDEKTFTQEQLDQDAAIAEKTSNSLCDDFKAALPYCPLTWLQQTVCRYLCEYAAKSIIKTEEPKQKFVLCRQFEKARKYINACN